MSSLSRHCLGGSCGIALVQLGPVEDTLCSHTAFCPRGLGQVQSCFWAVRMAASCTSQAQEARNPILWQGSVLLSSPQAAVALIALSIHLPADVCRGEAAFRRLCSEWVWLQQAESAETDLPDTARLQEGLLPARQLQIQVRVDSRSPWGPEEEWERLESNSSLLQEGFVSLGHVCSRGCLGDRGPRMVCTGLFSAGNMDRRAQLHILLPTASCPELPVPEDATVFSSWSS